MMMVIMEKWGWKEKNSPSNHNEMRSVENLYMEIGYVSKDVGCKWNEINSKSKDTQSILWYK